MKSVQLLVKNENLGERLDKYLTLALPDMTRSAVQKIISDGNVTVNGKIPSKNLKLNCNDRIDVIIPDLKELKAISQEIPLDIIYEDKDLLVVNKPQGMVVHPAAGNFDGTLVNALLFHCKGNLSGINGVIRPGIIHRIDKQTSGLLIVAKSNIAHLELAKQIKEHSFKRIYHTIVEGNIKDDKGTINFPIGRHSTNRKKMAVTQKNSREAITHYKVLERFGKYTYLQCELETGRTHQIRVHLSHIGHPVLGDTVYGNPKSKFNLKGQCLHAKTIGFVHPVSQKYLEFDSDLPDYFLNVLNKLT